MHPTRPIVAYNSGNQILINQIYLGCMIIVYDLLTDQKINLVHHEHEIISLMFTPPGAGSAPSTTGAGGELLISVDLNRNDMSDLSAHSNSTMCLWNWSKG
jgi:WD40 repeat protein